MNILRLEKTNKKKLIFYNLLLNDDNKIVFFHNVSLRRSLQNKISKLKLEFNIKLSLCNKRMFLLEHSPEKKFFLEKGNIFIVTVNENTNFQFYSSLLNIKFSTIGVIVKKTFYQNADLFLNSKFDEKHLKLNSLRFILIKFLLLLNAKINK